jgi:hypothetical protein
MRRSEEVELLGNVDPDVKGYGPLSEATRRLMASDLIDIKMEADGIHWSAELTPRGKKRLAGN